MRVCCCPTRRQRGRGDVVEVLGICLKEPTARTLYRARGNSSKDINPAPARSVVRRARCPAVLVGEKMRSVIHGGATRRDVVTQLWLGAPEQRHGASNVWSRHGRATESRISIIGSVIAGTSACARRGDIRFDPVTPIDCDRAAAAEGSNVIRPGLQSANRVRRGINSGRIHYSGTVRAVVTGSCHHHDPGSSLSFYRSLQCISRTTF